MMLARTPSALRVGVVLLTCVLGGCGPTASGAGPTTDDTMAAPPTDRDPPPWAPTPAEDPTTGDAVGIATSGGYDQARALALRVITAIRDRDAEALERSLADNLGRVYPRLTPPSRPRQDVVRALLQSPRRRGLGPDVPLDEIVDPRRMTVVPLQHREDGGEMPAGYAGNDLQVRFPLGPRGRQHFRTLLNWAEEGRMVIRPGTDPRVVAM